MTILPRTIPALGPSYLGDAIYLPNPHLIYLPIRKNAHTAIHEAIKASGNPWIPISTENRQSFFAPRICIWRSPYDRLASAYRFFSQHNQPKPIPSTSLPFSEWVLHAISVEDPHLMPQAKIVKLLYPDLPEHIIRWPRVDILTTQLMIPLPRGINISEPMTLNWTSDAREAVAAHYAEDLEIWSNL